MAGSAHRWWSLAELEEGSARLIVPPGQKWLVERAVELHRLWRDRDVELQPDLPDPREAKPK